MTIYLHETIDVVPGMADQYFEGLDRLWYQWAPNATSVASDSGQLGAQRMEMANRRLRPDINPRHRVPNNQRIEGVGGKGTVFLHEIVQALPGRADKYVNQVITRYHPIAKRRGMSLVGSCRSAMRNTEAVSIWAIRDWDHWADLQATISTGDQVQQWLRHIQEFRTDWIDKLLTPFPWNPLRG